MAGSWSARCTRTRRCSRSVRATVPPWRRAARPAVLPALVSCDLDRRTDDYLPERLFGLASLVLDLPLGSLPDSAFASVADPSFFFTSEACCFADAAFAGPVLTVVPVDRVTGVTSVPADSAGWPAGGAARPGRDSPGAGSATAEADAAR